MKAPLWDLVIPLSPFCVYLVLLYIINLRLFRLPIGAVPCKKCLFLRQESGAVTCRLNAPDFKTRYKSGAEDCDTSQTELPESVLKQLTLNLTAEKLRLTLLFSIATIIITALIAIFKQGR